MNKVIKGLMMAAAMVFTAMQGPDFIWQITAVTTGAFFIGYLVKNAIWPSISDDGVFDWRDIASAAIIAACAAIPETVNQWFVGDAVNWLQVAKIAGVAVFTYLTATFGFKTK